MKTYNNLYPQITAFENLYHAYRLARRGKRERVAVANFEFNLESDLLQLQEELQSQTYQPGMYHNFFIFEPKRRLVSAAPFLTFLPMQQSVCCISYFRPKRNQASGHTRI